MPTLAQLAPYTQSLAVYEYKVDKVRAGTYPDQKLYVAHWAILDNTRLPFAEVSPGAKYTLILEPFEDQPQLQSENLNDSIVEDFSLPLFYDAGGTSLGFDTAAELATENANSASTVPAVVAGSERAAKSTAPTSDAVRQSRLRDMDAVKQQLKAQETRAGGYAAWTESLAAFREAIKINADSHNLNTIVGSDRHLFSRSGVSYLLDTDLFQMSGAPVPPAAVILEFNRQLKSQGIDLIFVPVPAREEVYPEKLSAAPAHHLVSPQMTQFLQSLLDNGVEVVDLRDAFLDERIKHEEPLYTISDTHWGTDGIRRAAAEIGKRLSRYGFGDSLPRIEYSEKTIYTAREGDLVRSLPETAKSAYPKQEWEVSQVIDPNGQVYKGAEQSPVLVLGDSFAMRYDQEGGQLSAHLARELGFPVTTLSSKGGGPKLPRLLASKGVEYIASHRVVVWVMASRYLGDPHANEWEKPPATALDEARSRDIAAVKEQLAAQVTLAGGYPAWTASLSSFREAIRTNAQSHDRYTIMGLEKQLFSRSGVDYLLDPDLAQMPSAPNQPAAISPVDVIAGFSQQLRDRGIDLVYVPVPAREEVYPEKLSAAAPAHHLVSPQLTQLLQALTDKGVEVVDLRETFLDERTKHEDLLYPISEVHWGTYAIRRAAAEIAPRLRRYQFSLSSPPVEYTEKSIRIPGQGNLVGSLPDSAKADYPPFEQDIVQVIDPDGNLYQDVEDSPVVVMGDSFTMWLVKEGGSLSAHLAKELKAPVSNAPSKGGGPKVPRVLAAKGPEYLAPRRVVVWAMVSRYLADSYAAEWELPPPLE